MSEQLEVPTHVLIKRIRQELGDSVSSLTQAISMDSYMHGQDEAERIKLLLGLLEAVTEDSEGVYT